jgi:hypothetical protein
MVGVENIHRAQEVAGALGQGDAEMIARVGKGNTWNTNDIGFVVLILFAAGDKDPNGLTQRLQRVLEHGDVVGDAIGGRFIDVSQ